MKTFIEAVKIYLNKIFNVDNIPFTIGWLIGMIISGIITMLFEPFKSKPFFEVFDLTWLIVQIFGLLMWLTIINYWKEIIRFYIELYYKSKDYSIKQYHNFKTWLYN